jgi:hypothetical protein
MPWYQIISLLSQYRLLHRRCMNFNTSQARHDRPFGCSHPCIACEPRPYWVSTNSLLTFGEVIDWKVRKLGTECLETRLPAIIFVMRESVVHVHSSTKVWTDAVSALSLSLVAAFVNADWLELLSYVLPFFMWCSTFQDSATCLRFGRP